MPLYTIIDTVTGESEQFWGSYAALQEKLSTNPNLQQELHAPAIISGRSDQTSKLPDGFKDKLRDIKAKHPESQGIDHLI